MGDFYHRILSRREALSRCRLEAPIMKDILPELVESAEEEPPGSADGDLLRDGLSSGFSMFSMQPFKARWFTADNVR